MTTIVNPVVDTSGAAPEGHDEKMIAKVDATQAALESNDAPEVDQPKLAGKFNSVEDLEKAYAELSKKLGQQGQEKVNQPAPEGGMDEGKAAELVEQAGLNLDAMSEHYAANGELSEDHYAALEKAGISREFVDAYIAGQEARATQAQDAIVERIGGAEKFQAMSDWARTNLTDAELAAYNAAVSSNDLIAAENAVLGLAYRYTNEVGKDPKLVGGSGAGTGGAFQSLAQVTAAMKDPRYSTDPAYRREVEQRLANSTVM